MHVARRQRASACVDLWEAQRNSCLNPRASCHLQGVPPLLLLLRTHRSTQRLRLRAPLVPSLLCSSPPSRLPFSPLPSPMYSMKCASRPAASAGSRSALLELFHTKKKKEDIDDTRNRRRTPVHTHTHRYTHAQPLARRRHLAELWPAHMLSSSAPLEFFLCAAETDDPAPSPCSRREEGT